MYQMYHHCMFLFSIMAATAVSVCLIPNTKPVVKGVDQSDDEHDHLDDYQDDDDEGDDDEGNHQDDVVQDLCACMAVLVIDVDHGNQKEQESNYNLKRQLMTVG